MPNTAIDQQGFRSSLALMGFQELNPGSWYLLRGAYFFIVTEGEKADLLTFGLAARIRSQKPVSLLFPARDPQRVDGFIARLTHEPSLAVPDTEEEEPAEETGEAPVPAPTAEIPEPVVTVIPAEEIEPDPVEEPTAGDSEAAGEDAPAVYVSIPLEGEEPVPTPRSAYDVLDALFQEADKKSEPETDLTDEPPEISPAEPEETPKAPAAENPEKPREIKGKTMPPWPEKLRFF